MNSDHVDAYFKAMSDKDFAQIAQHLSENVVLLSPVFPEPFEGKEAAPRTKKIDPHDAVSDRAGPSRAAGVGAIDMRGVNTRWNAIMPDKKCERLLDDCHVRADKSEIARRDRVR